jgi:hypothetical protein
VGTNRKAAASDRQLVT